MREEFRPNYLKKVWYKFTNTEKYKKYKQFYSHHKLTNRLQRFECAGLNTTLEEILLKSENYSEINVLHNGNAGDIIYSLPLIKKLKELAEKPILLILKINEPLLIGNGYEHPLGSVILNQKMVDALAPLLAAQSYIDKVEVFSDQVIHLDLTLFRKAGFALDKGSIARWSFFTTGITADLGTAWLNLTADDTFADYIVLARSSRYNNALIDYSFLSNYKKLIFVGVQAEYEEMKKSIPTLKWRPVNDFLELAQIIAGCKLFIGNQSFPFSLAEGLKVKRLLEVFYQIPNVLPEGHGGYDFVFQKHFESLVTSIMQD